MNTKTATKPAEKTKPAIKKIVTEFAGESPYTEKAEVAFTEESISFEITDDPYMGRQTSSKYDDLINKTKVGQRIKSPPDCVGSLAAATVKWLKKRGMYETHKVISVMKYPKDGMGGVWIVERKK